jgi:hypothetical protein
VVAYQMYLGPKNSNSAQKVPIENDESWVWIFGYKIHLICSHNWGENFIHYFMIMHSFTMRIVKYISSQEMSNATWRNNLNHFHFWQFETKRNLVQKKKIDT